MVSLKRLHVSISLWFLPSVVQILVGRLDSSFLSHIKKYMTTIHALIFEKHIKMCVYIRQIKKPVQIDFTLGEYMQQKKLAGRAFFQNTGSQGLGRKSPGGSSRAVPSSHFFMLF